MIVVLRTRPHTDRVSRPAGKLRARKRDEWACVRSGACERPRKACQPAKSNWAKLGDYLTDRSKARNSVSGCEKNEQVRMQANLDHPCQPESRAPL